MFLCSDMSKRPSASRSRFSPARCPHCGDMLVAPESSEFVDEAEIRHHWACDACGGTSRTSIPVVSH